MQTWFPCESDSFLVYVCFVCVYVCNQLDRFPLVSLEGFGRGNEGFSSPQTSFPCKRVFPGVQVCMFAISSIVFQW